MRKLATAAAILGASVIHSAAQEGYRPAKEPQSSPSTRPPLRAVPMKDYWDAHRWDPAGGSKFFRSLQETPRPALLPRKREAADPPAAENPHGSGSRR